MKKIYYIANARMPTEKAHGIQLAKMCEAFINQGIDLELIVPNRAHVLASLKEFYGLSVDVPIKKIPVIDWYASGHIGFVIGSLLFAIGYYFYLLAKRLYGEHFIIYMTDIDQFSFFLIPCIGVPYFCEIHDAKKRRRMFRFLFRHAAGIITINTIIKKELSLTFALSPARIIVHPNGIDMKMFDISLQRNDAREKLGQSGTFLMALYIGKFYDWKGLDTAVESARIAGDSIEFYFVGGTKEDLIAATKITDIPKNIHCMGHQPFQQIPVWLAAADVVLLLGTKRNDYSYLHTSPMKSFEYMAAQKPIVASATPANWEILTDQEAMMYKPDDAPDLARVIFYALSHREEANEYSRRAYEKVKGFSWNRRGALIKEFMAHHI